MALSEEDIKGIAHLARLSLSEDEIARLGPELDAIVGYVEQLKQVDTTGIETMAQVTGLEHVTREDLVQPMLEQNDVLANGPVTNAEAFLVPKAVER